MIVVMLAVLFLGVAASYELTEDVNILDYGLDVAAVILAAGVTVYLFAKVHDMRHEHDGQLEEAVGELEDNGLPTDGSATSIQ